jgi:4-hydroxy-tetrahydrodipicolinate synthase
MFQGSIVAIVSPMHADGSLDLVSYRKLVDWHIESGTSAIVAVGTTGESPTVSAEENVELVKIALDQAKGRIPIIAGTGSNSTREAVEMTREAAKLGAAASLQVVPYYNKPTQEGLYQHFKTIAEAVDLPVLLYNVPSRTVADLANDTVIRLAQVPGIRGLKDATGDMPRASDLIARLPAGFSLLSGNDDSCLALMALGGSGVISVTANIAPKQMAQMCHLALAGDFVSARAINQKLLPIHFKLFVEANPIPVKWALAKMGRCGPAVRLPMTALTPSFGPIIEAAMQAAGVE